MQYRFKLVKTNYLYLSLFSILYFVFMSIETYADSTSTAFMFKGNPQHTGYYNTNGNIDAPKIKWQFKSNGAIISSPVIYKGSVFFGSKDSCLYSINEETSELNWYYKTGGEVNSTPAVFDNIAYFTSMDGKFYALNSETGDLVWNFETGGEKLYSKTNLYSISSGPIKDAYDFFMSSPVVINNMVYFGSRDSNFYALDSRTGEEKWRFKTGDIISSSPAAFDGKIYFGSMDRYFYALDAITGEVIWKFKTGDDFQMWVMAGIQSSPAIADSSVYFGSRDAFLYSLNAFTGDLNWKKPNSNSWVLSSPSIYDGRIFYGTSDSYKLNAIKCNNGAISFSKQLFGYVYSSPAISGNTLYIGCFSGTLFAIDIEKRIFKWKFFTEGHKTDKNNVLFSDGRLNGGKFSFTSESSLFNSMKKVFSIGTILSSPVVNNGVVFFGSTDSTLYALENDETVDVENERIDNLDYKLNQNYPNPFNPTTLISYNLPKTSYVNIKVYDTLGKEIKTLVSEQQELGFHEVEFDASEFSSGIYYYKLSSENNIQVKKMMLLK